MEQNITPEVIPRDEDFHEMYMNGYKIGISPSDLVLEIHKNGKLLGIINLSYNTAKSLAAGLNETIQFVETQTGMNIRMITEIDSALNKGTANEN